MRTVKDVMDRDRTANQWEFSVWLEREARGAGLVLKSEAARDAFRLGAMLGIQTYPIYQAAKPTSTRYAAPEPAKAAEAAPKNAKPRVRKATK